MQNLAGHKQAHDLVCAELERASVRRLPVAFRHSGPEVPARVVGVITHADGTITVLSRLWYYFAVRSSRPLKRDPGMGHVVRVEGSASGGGSLTIERDAPFFTLTLRTASLISSRCSLRSTVVTRGARHHGRRFAATSMTRCWPPPNAIDPVQRSIEVPHE